MTSSGVRSVIWSTLGVLSQGVGRLVANVLVGRTAGAAALGSMATVLAVGQILAALWPSSLGSAGVKFVAQARGRDDHEAIVQVRGHLALRSLQTCVLLALLGCAGWALVGGSWQECVAVAVVVLGLGTFSLVQGLLYADRRIRSSSLRETVVALVSLALVVAMLAVDTSIDGAWLALPLAVGMLAFAAFGWPRQRPRSMSGLGRELDLFTTTSALGAISSQGFLQLSVVAASIIGRESAGQFAVALALCTPLTLVVTPLGLALFPAVNEAVGRGDTASVRRQITVATHFLAYALLAGGGFLVLMREPVISTVWGTGFAEASRIFVPLVAAASLGALALPATNGMTSASQRYATQATAWSLGSSVVGIASWFALIPLWGSVGVAVGLLLGRTIYVVAVLESVRRLHGVSSWMGLAARVALVLGAVAAVDQLFGGVVLQVLVFSLVGLAVVASDKSMRVFIGEQVPWLARR